MHVSTKENVLSYEKSKLESVSEVCNKKIVKFIFSGPKSWN